MVPVCWTSAEHLSLDGCIIGLWLQTLALVFVPLTGNPWRRGDKRTHALTRTWLPMLKSALLHVYGLGGDWVKGGSPVCAHFVQQHTMWTNIMNNLILEFAQFYFFTLSGSKTLKICRTTSLVKGELIYMTRTRDKEKSESATGIEPLTSRTPGGRSIHWAKLRELMENKVTQRFWCIALHPRRLPLPFNSSCTTSTISSRSLWNQRLPASVPRPWLQLVLACCAILCLLNSTVPPGPYRVMIVYRSFLSRSAKIFTPFGWMRSKSN